MAKKNDATTFYGGMTFKEFRNAGRRPIDASDLVWAGRLYPKFPYWNRRLSNLSVGFMLVAVLSLAGVWGSVLLRKPALLLGVYPDGEIICFPRLRTLSGEPSTLHPVYVDQCAKIDERVGRKWQTNNTDAISDAAAIGNMNAQVVYKNVADIIQSRPVATQQAQVVAPAPAYSAPALDVNGVPGVTPVQPNPQNLPPIPGVAPAQPIPEEALLGG